MSGIQLLGRPAEQTPQELLELMLQALDPAVLLFLVLQEFITLGAEEFEF